MLEYRGRHWQGKRSQLGARAPVQSANQSIDVPMVEDEHLVRWSVMEVLLGTENRGGTKYTRS